MLPEPPRPEPIRIDVTVTLHRRVGWLAAGVAIGALRVPDLLLAGFGLLARALQHCS